MPLLAHSAYARDSPFPTSSTTTNLSALLHITLLHTLGNAIPITGCLHCNGCRQQRRVYFEAAAKGIPGFQHRRVRSEHTCQHAELVGSDGTAKLRCTYYAGIDVATSGIPSTRPTEQPRKRTSCVNYGNEVVMDSLAASKSAGMNA